MTDVFWLNTRLTNGQIDEFKTVKTHLGIDTNADVVRFLIRQMVLQLEHADRLVDERTQYFAEKEPA